MSDQKHLLNLVIDFPTLARHTKKRNQIFRVMAGMIRRGFALPDLLNALAESSFEFHYGLRRMAVLVEEGATLSEAMSKQWRLRPPLVLELVKLGEQRGVLDVTMTLAHELLDPERHEDLKQGYRSILAYLALIMGVVIVVAATLLTLVVPTFALMFEDMGKELPQATQFVVALSSYAWLLWLLVLAPPIAWVMARLLKGLTATEKIPLLGKVIKYSRWWRIAYGTGVLLEADVPLDQALGAIGRALQYPALEPVAARIAARLKEGMEPAAALAEEKSLPAMIQYAAAQGVSTGDLAEALITTGIIKREMESALASKLAPALEVLGIVVVALTTGFFILSIYLPIFGFVGDLF